MLHEQKCKVQTTEQPRTLKSLRKQLLDYFGDYFNYSKTNAPPPREGDEMPMGEKTEAVRNSKEKCDFEPPPCGGEMDEDFIPSSGWESEKSRGTVGHFFILIHLWGPMVGSDVRKRTSKIFGGGHCRPLSLILGKGACLGCRLAWDAGWLASSALKREKTVGLSLSSMEGRVPCLLLLEGAFDDLLLLHGGGRRRHQRRVRPRGLLGAEGRRGECTAG